MRSLALFGLGCALAAASPSSPWRRQDSQDDFDPSSSDPQAPGQIKQIPRPPTNPFANGIPKLPPQCTDSVNPSEDCLKARQASDGGVQAFMGKISHDGTCKEDDREGQIATAAWDAFTFASHATPFYATNQGKDTAHFYMGPDWFSQQGRIDNNLQRAVNFTAKGDSYITVGCGDPKGWCNKGPGQGSGLAGYAWTYKGWFGYKYYYINLCRPFFSSVSLDARWHDVQAWMTAKDVKRLKDATNFHTQGQFFLHEMMHLDLIGDPPIIDEFIDPEGGGAAKAYGPKRVHMLAQRSLAKGGGATRASTNADSYAWMTSAMYWWGTSGYFPGVPGKANPVSKDDIGPVMVHVGDFDSVSTSTLTDNVFLSTVNAYMPDGEVAGSPAGGAKPPPDDGGMVEEPHGPPGRTPIDKTIV